MAICSKEEVRDYILDMKAKLMLDWLNNLHIVEREDRKNQDCMAELGLRHRQVATILENLEIENYSETVEDIDRPGNWLWVFGTIHEEEHELYIKISLRSKVVCISFHEKERDITYPYRE